MGTDPSDCALHGLEVVGVAPAPLFRARKVVHELVVELLAGRTARGLRRGVRHHVGRVVVVVAELQRVDEAVHLVGLFAAARAPRLPPPLRASRWRGDGRHHSHRRRRVHGEESERVVRGRRPSPSSSLASVFLAFLVLHALIVLFLVLHALIVQVVLVFLVFLVPLVKLVVLVLVLVAFVHGVGLVGRDIHAQLPRQEDSVVVALNLFRI